MDLTKTDLLDQEICNCGTVKEAIDKALDEAFAGDDCPVWDLLMAMLVTNIKANIFCHDLMVKGTEGGVAKAETIKHMKTLEFVIKEIMRRCGDYIEQGIIERVAKEADKEEETSEEIGTIH
jgi:hypothetical protein